MAKADPGVVIDLIEAFRRSKAMFTGCEIGIFEALANGDATAAELGVMIGANTASLERLLDALVGLALLEKQEDLYRNSAAASAYLLRRSPDTLTGYVMYSNEVLYKMWGNLGDAVREGSNRWKQTFDLDGPLFSSFFQTEESMRMFIAGMHGFGMISSPPVVAAFDLSRFKRLVDLGGATGHLPMAAAERYPEMETAVFDLPQVIKVAREHCAATRVECIEGDFFLDELPPGDLYALGRILHDWNDEKIRRLLKKIAESLPSGGGLLIAERLLTEDKTRPVNGTMQSLNMLICTEGRERSLSEYEALCLEAGFKVVEGRRTGALVDAILAVKG